MTVTYEDLQSYVQTLADELHASNKQLRWYHGALVDVIAAENINEAKELATKGLTYKGERP